MTIGDRIKDLRKNNLKLTLDEFGLKIGLKKSALSLIENGKNSSTEQTIKSICREFNVSEQWLRTGEGEMFVPRSRAEQIEKFMESVAVDNGFKARFVSMLAGLDESEWALLEKMALKLAEESSFPQPQDREMTKEEKIAEYARQLDLEKETKGRSGASRSIA